MGQDDPDFSREFIPAIERTIRLVVEDPSRFEDEDAADL